MPGVEPPYAGLTPERVLDALDSVGVRGDGRLFALNSYENRVFQVWRDEEPPVVAKFYRPARWTDAQILEEHAFAAELAAREVPVVASLVLEGRTLHEFDGFRFSVFKQRGGRSPELEDPSVLEWIGRFLGRIHAVGSGASFQARPALDIDSFGNEPREYLLESDFIPDELRDAWVGAVDMALDRVRAAFGTASGAGKLRLHGDCHGGNILWTPDGPHFVDLDDSRTGPAVQDLWMLLSGEREVAEEQLRKLLEGYEVFREFDRVELMLIEPLRTLRLIHYSAWIARRWDDPAFPAAFPWFNTSRYWQDRILEMKEQASLMDEAPLSV